MRRIAARASGMTLHCWRGRWARLPSFASEVRRQLAAGAASGARGVGRFELAGLVDASGLWDEEGVTLALPVQRSPAP